MTARLEKTSADLPPALHVALENCNRPDLKALTPKECEEAFQKGTRGAQAAGREDGELGEIAGKGRARTWALPAHRGWSL